MSINPFDLILEGVERSREKKRKAHREVKVFSYIKKRNF